MYIFVTVTETQKYYSDGPVGKAKVRIEEASGERCLIVPYQEFGMDTVRELKPRAIVMSGFGKYFQTRRIDSFFGMDAVLHAAELPILCICGSHQLLGFSFNLNLRRTKILNDQPIRRLGPHEDFPREPALDPEYDTSGYFAARGFFPIERAKDDPLFRGLPKTMLLKCSHYCEVKRLPREFVILASSGHSRIEAMRHKTRPLYGTQFHPEQYEKPFLHGRRMLENFSEIARSFWRAHGTARR